MRNKVFALVAAFLMMAALSMAQENISTITFSEAAAAGTLNESVFSSGDLSLEVVDPNGKVSIDASNSIFIADSEKTISCTHRLKTGGKTDANITANYLKLMAGVSGQLRIGVRSGSNSATDRTLVITQNGEELFNQPITEDMKESVEMEEGFVVSQYHMVVVDVEAGELILSYPVGSLNFYCFQLEGNGGSPVNPEEPEQPVIPEQMIEGPIVGTLVGGEPVLNTGYSTSSQTRGGFIVRADGVYFCNRSTGYLGMADLDLNNFNSEAVANIGGAYYMDQDEAGNIILYEWMMGSSTLDVVHVYDAQFNFIRDDSLTLNGRCDMPSVAGNVVSGRGAYLVAANSATSVLRFNYVDGVQTSVDEIPVPESMGGNSSVAPLDVDRFYVQSRGKALLYVDCSGETPVVTNIPFFSEVTFTSTYGGKAFEFAGHKLYVMGTYKVGQYGGSFAVFDVTDPTDPVEICADPTTIGTSTMGTAHVAFRVVKEGGVAHIYEYARYHVRKYDLTVSPAMYIRQGNGEEASWQAMQYSDDVYTYDGVYTASPFYFNARMQEDGAQTFNVDEMVVPGDTIHVTYDPQRNHMSLEVTGAYVASLTFNVTVPEGTQNCYITGSFSDWTFVRMNQLSQTEYTYTYIGAGVANVENVVYKYLAGPDWAYVEKDAEGMDMPDRHWTENDIVVMWSSVPAVNYISYELNGGVTNDYGWTSKGAIALDLQNDWNAMYGSTQNWAKWEDGVYYYKIAGEWLTETQAIGQQAMVADFIQNKTWSSDGKFINLVTSLMYDKYGWLKDVMIANHSAAGMDTSEETLVDAYYRKEVSAIILESPADDQWPVTPDYSIAGKTDEIMKIWHHGFANPETVNQTFTLNAPYKEGYIFGGWYLTPDFSGERVYAIDDNTPACTLYAKWEESGQISTIAEVKQMAENVTVTLGGVVTYIRGKNVYVQDETAGILVYTIETPTCNVGDYVTASGLTKIYGGAPEITSATIEVVESGVDLPAELPISLADLLADPLAHFGERVFVEGLTVSGFDSKNNLKVTDGWNTALCYNIVPDQAIYTVGAAIKLHLVAAYYNAFQFVGTADGLELVPESHLYLLGDITNWDPTSASEMRKVEDGIFEGTYEFTNDLSWFTFVTALASPEDEDQWGIINANRYGGADNDWVGNGTVAQMYHGTDLCFTINQGTYKFRVNMNNMTFSVENVSTDLQTEVFRIADYIWLDESSYTEFEAGTQIYAGSNFDVKLPFTDSWRFTFGNQPNGEHHYYQLNNQSIYARYGMQGQSNPKDATGASISGNNTLTVPASGSCLQIDAKQNGKVLVFFKAASNKSYFVFENGHAKGYSLAMQTYADPSLGDNGLLAYTLKGEDNLYNYLTSANLLASTGYDNVQIVENYINTDPSATGIEQGMYRQNGMAVMAFDAFEGNNYIVGAGGSKMIYSAVAFLSGNVEGTQVIAQGTDGYADVMMMSLTATGEPAPIIYDTVTVRLDPNTVDWAGAKVYVWTGHNEAYYPAYGYSGASRVLWGEPAPMDDDGWWSASFTVREGTTYHLGWLDASNDRAYPYNDWCVYDQTGSICTAYNEQLQVVNCYSLLPDSSNTFTVHVPTAGTLGLELIDVINNNWTGVLALHITGTLNEADFAILNRLSECQVLDLSGTNITHFTGCQGMLKLREVVLPTTLTKIDDYAFYYCRRLSNINLENVEEIGQYAFCNCVSLKNLSLPNLMYLNHYAFAEEEWLAYQYGGLETVSMPVVQTIGDNAFRGCIRLQSAELPLATEIGRYAFSRCYSLTQIDLSNVTKIGDEAFYMEDGYSDLYPMLSHVILSDELTSIPYNCFCRCPIAEVNFPASLQRIENQAFSSASIQNVIIPEGVTYLGSNNFHNASTITIPASIAEMRAFTSNWQAIYCYAADPNFQVGFDSYTDVSSSTLYVPAVSLNAYRLHDNWYRFGQILPLEGDVDKLDIRGPFALTTVTGLANKANMTLHPNAELTMSASDALHLGNFMQYVGTRSEYHSEWKYDWDYYGDYREYRIYSYRTPLTGSMITNQAADADNVEIRLVPKGNQWTFFSLPYDVNMADITTEAVGDMERSEIQWVIRYYSGDNRASGQGDTWLNVPADGVLQAHKGYILYWTDGSWYNPSEENYVYFRLPAANATRQNIFASDDVNVPLTEYVAEYPQNSSWNLVGNPYPSFFDIAEMDFDAPITTWNGSSYVAYSLLDDDYNLRPAEAFFVQAPEGVSSIAFHKEGRNNTVSEELTEEEYNNRGHGYNDYYAPARREAMTTVGRRIYNFTLANDQYSDRARLVLNEQASLSYERTCDAAKMMSSNSAVPQLFINENGIRYAIDERPEGNGTYTLGAYFGQDGTYTLHLSAAQMDGTEVLLTDTQTGMTTNLSANDYTFTATAGTNSTRFLISVRLNTPTGANNFGAYDKPIKLIENDHLVIITPNGEKYSVEGQRL